MGNLHRQTEFNRKAFLSFIEEQTYDIENEHVLVGLLQQLSINAEWDLQYVVSYTRFRAYSLCTMFKITSMSHVGSARTDGFYRESVREHWCLIENDKRYQDNVSLEELRPVIPLCSTVTKHMYTHTFNRDDRVNSTYNDLAIMGVDLVELAVGWWLYQRQNLVRDAGVHAYVAKFVLTQAQLCHNQLSVINILYEHFVHGVVIDDLIVTDSVVFNTVSEKRLLSIYYTHLVKALTGRRLANFEHFLSIIESIYAKPYFNYVQAGKSALFSQTVWCWEPALMKLYSVYLTLANREGHILPDVNTLVLRTHAKRINNYQRIQETYFRGWFYELADDLLGLVQENLKK